LYRLMKMAPDGRPLVGNGSMMLGVRPRDPAQPIKRYDVPAVVGTDIVRPGDGGLSCYNDPDAITIRSGKLELWSIEVRLLPAELAAQPAGEPHFHIEPRRAVTLDELQQLLAAARELWERE
jgi:hypothetical protein